MHLLNRLTSRVLDPAAYGVVEDVDLLDARYLVAQQVFNFFVVSDPYSTVVGEQLLLGRIVVDCKAGVVGCKLMFSSSQVVYVSDMGLAFEVLTRAVDLGPRLLRVGTGIDVDEAGCRHVECMSWSCFGHPKRGLSGYP